MLNLSPTLQKILKFNFEMIWLSSAFSHYILLFMILLVGQSVISLWKQMFTQRWTGIIGTEESSFLPGLFAWVLLQLTSIRSEMSHAMRKAVVTRRFKAM
jgi:hypothetical protein